MCSPRTETDANRKPSRSEINNCSTFLRRQIELINPAVVATLGAVALDALKAIDPHKFMLKEHAGTVQNWYGVVLVPLYHPSPQVIAAQKGLERQLMHIQILAGII